MEACAGREAASVGENVEQPAILHVLKYAQKISSVYKEVDKVVVGQTDTAPPYIGSSEVHKLNRIC